MVKTETYTWFSASIRARSDTKSKSLFQPASRRKFTYYRRACILLNYNGTINGRPNSIQITKLWRAKLAHFIAVVELVKCVNAKNGKSDTCSLCALEFKSFFMSIGEWCGHRIDILSLLIQLNHYVGMHSLFSFIFSTSFDGDRKARGERWQWEKRKRGSWLLLCNSL